MTGTAKPRDIKNRSKVAPKLIKKLGEWRKSSLADPFLSTPDLFNAYPVTAGDANRAIQREAILNKQFNQDMDKVKLVDDIIDDLVDLGTAIVKTTWENLTEMVTRTVPIYEYLLNKNPQLQARYAQLSQLRLTDIEKYKDYSTPGIDTALDKFEETGETYLPLDMGEEKKEIEIDIVNRPLIQVCDHENVIVDPSCGGDYTKAGFMIEMEKTSLSALRKDGNYINIDNIIVDSADPTADPDYEEVDDTDSFTYADKVRRLFVVRTYWGYWDIKDSGTTEAIVVSWVGNTIIRMDKMPFVDNKHPFTFIVNRRVRGSVYGEPDGELLEDNQKVIGAVTRGMLDLFSKSANGQIGFRHNSLDPLNYRRYKSGLDYEFRGNVHPSELTYAHQYPETPGSVYNLLNYMNNEAESLTAVKAFHSGISGQALGNVATGIRSALDATSKRELSILRRISKGFTEIGYKVMGMNSEFLSEAEVVRTTSNDFVQVRRDDLQGKADIRLSISTAEEDNRTAEELVFMLQTLGNNADPALSKLILVKIANLRKQPDLSKSIAEYEPTPDPFTVKKQQLELAELQAKVAKEQALAIKHSAAAELDNIRQFKEGSQGALNQAKSVREIAKANLENSLADMANLDFLESESGVRQERDLEKIREQGSVQTSLALINNMIQQAQLNQRGQE
jgi:hypothetical protein